MNLAQENIRRDNIDDEYYRHDGRQDKSRWSKLVYTLITLLIVGNVAQFMLIIRHKNDIGELELSNGKLLQSLKTQ